MPGELTGIQLYGLELIDSPFDPWPLCGTEVVP